MLRLKDLREDKDLLQKDIADILKITQQQYSKVELGINQLQEQPYVRIHFLHLLRNDELKTLFF